MAKDFDRQAALRRIYDGDSALIRLILDERSKQAFTGDAEISCHGNPIIQHVIEPVSEQGPDLPVWRVEAAEQRRTESFDTAESCLRFHRQEQRCSGGFSVG